MAIKKKYFEEGIFLGVRGEARNNRFFAFVLNLRHVKYCLYKTFAYHDLSETYCKCIYHIKRSIVSTYLLFIFLTLSILTKEFNQTLYLQLNSLANIACSRWIRSEIRYHRTRVNSKGEHFPDRRHSRRSKLRENEILWSTQRSGVHKRAISAFKGSSQVVVCRVTGSDGSLAKDRGTGTRTVALLLFIAKVWIGFARWR